MPWYADLELERHGAHYIEPELNVALLTARRPRARMVDRHRADGRVVRRVQPARRRDACGAGSTNSCRSCSDILLPESRSPPLPPDERRAAARAQRRGPPPAGGERALAARIRAAGVRASDRARRDCCSSTACARSTCACAASATTSRRCSRARPRRRCRAAARAALARALEAAVRESGGEIRLMTEPARIVVENGRAVGVETQRRRDHPRAAVRRLLAQSARRPSWTCSTMRSCRARSASRSSASSTICWRRCLRCTSICASRRATRQPPTHPELARAFMVIMGLDHVDQFHDIVRHHEAGTIPPTVMWGACPTLFDPSQAPPGRHTAFMWEKLPYRLHGDAGELGRRARRAWPARCWRCGGNTRPTSADAVIDSFTRSPLDVERCAAEHARGRSAGRRVHQRPGRLSTARSAAPATYRTHIPRLYLCGSSSHPGRQRHRPARLQRRAGHFGRPRSFPALMGAFTVRLLFARAD